MEELEHILRRTRTSKLKDETKISYLRRELGPEAEKWLMDLPVSNPDDVNIHRNKLDLTEINRKLSIGNVVKG